MTYAGNKANLDDVAEGIAFVRGDICDQPLVEQLLCDHGVETVVNFAAESHNSYAILNPTAFFSSNVMGPVILLEAIRRLGGCKIRFHQISTCEVYGDMDLDDPGAFHESSPYLPRTPYNAAKASGDHAVRAFGLTYDIPLTITNCCNNYGAYQFPEKVIPLFVTNALQGKALPLYKSSQNRREWLHVEDHCRAIDAVLERGRIGETYHVGSGIEASVEALADAILDELKLPATMKHIVADRPNHDRRYLLDSTKLRGELGWEPLHEFAQGLRETIRWYQANEAWWRPLLGRCPVDEQSAWSKATIQPDGILGTIRKA